MTASPLREYVGIPEGVKEPLMGRVLSSEEDWSFNPHLRKSV